MKKNYHIFIKRREELVQNIKQKYQNKEGILIFFAPFENEKYRFRQESSLYYFSGLEEPGMVLLVDFQGSTMVYLAQYSEPRSKWASSILYNADKNSLSSWGITDIQYLGDFCKGYSINASCFPAQYEYLIKVLKNHVAAKRSIYTTYSNAYNEQRLLIDRVIGIIPELKDYIVDISDIIAAMRRKKTKQEIENIYKAVDCTMAAHEAAASIIDSEKIEYEVQAVIEFIFTQSGAQAAFPSIVASGQNSTVLHYMANNKVMSKDELVIIDIGAELDYYCADLTRTYPVSGVFSKRQLEIYKAVLDTQEYIENLVKPGLWINNKDKPKESLQHLALEFLQKKGYAEYFTHGIGHFLGMDVHDVGDYSKPLQEGDVIAIEPGLYISKEKIGVRIEDNYWVVSDGVICLSQDLPKNPHKIEDLMAQEPDDILED